MGALAVCVSDDTAVCSTSRGTAVSRMFKRPDVCPVIDIRCASSRCARPPSDLCARMPSVRCLPVPPSSTPKILVERPDGRSFVMHVGGAK